MGYILTVVHIILFFIIRRKLRKKANLLQLDNAELRREKQKLEGERNYYKSQLFSVLQNNGNKN